MKRQEIYDYYSALNATSRLIDIDCKDSLGTIEQKLLKVSKNTLGTFHIEIFKGDENIQSYSLSEIYNDGNSDEPMYSLWEQKTSKVNNTTLDDLAKYIHDNLPKDISIPFTHFVESIDKNQNTITIVSMDDEENKKTIDIPTKASELKKILGCLTYEDGSVVIKPVNHADLSKFLEIIENIETKKIKTFAKTYIRLIPDYVFEVPMNRLDRTENASDADRGGMQRHSINMARLVIALSQLDFYKIKFSRAEIDKMIVACLFSSFLRGGWQDEYEIDSRIRSDYTKSEAQAIRAMTGILEKNDLKFIANLVEAHLGSTDDSVLSVDTECKFLVYMANFLAGNESIAIKSNGGFYVFDEENTTIVTKTVPVSPDIISILNIALSRDIDMSKAESLNIHRNEENIRALWKDIIETKCYAPNQQKYIDLAMQMQFF